jgi:hypothetical protein
MNLVRLFLCLIAALVIGVAVIVTANALTLDRAPASLLGDAAFVSALAILLWRNPGISLGSAGSVLGAVVAFIMSSVILAALGGALYFSLSGIGRVLVHVYSIGFYPAGADVPFDFGSLFWAFSMMALCAAGLLLGGLLRWLGQRQES